MHCTIRVAKTKALIIIALFSIGNFRVSHDAAQSVITNGQSVSQLYPNELGS